MSEIEIESELFPCARQHVYSFFFSFSFLRQSTIMIFFYLLTLQVNGFVVTSDLRIPIPLYQAEMIQRDTV